MEDIKFPFVIDLPLLVLLIFTSHLQLYWNPMSPSAPKESSVLIICQHSFIFYLYNCQLLNLNLFFHYYLIKVFISYSMNAWKCSAPTKNWTQPRNSKTQYGMCSPSQTKPEFLNTNFIWCTCKLKVYNESFPSEKANSRCTCKVHIQPLANSLPKGANHMHELLLCGDIISSTSKYELEKIMRSSFQSNSVDAKI